MAERLDEALDRELLLLLTRGRPVLGKDGKPRLGADGKPIYRKASAADLSLIARRVRDLGLVSRRRQKDLERLAEDELVKRLEAGGVPKAAVLRFPRSNTDGAA